MSTLKAPELLLPAGSLDKMRAAYDYGADAIYAGQPRYSLRARNNEFRFCLLYTSPSPRDTERSRMPSSA